MSPSPLFAGRLRCGPTTGSAQQPRKRPEEQGTTGRGDCGVSAGNRPGPNYAAAFGNLGNALRDKGELVEAIEAYRQSSRSKPTPPRHQLSRECRRDNGQLDEAVVAYRQAIALRPDYPADTSISATVLKDMGRTGRGRRGISSGHCPRPDYPEAYNSRRCALATGISPSRLLPLAVRRLPSVPATSRPINLAWSLRPGAGSTSHRRLPTGHGLSPIPPKLTTISAMPCQTREQMDEAIAACRHADCPQARLRRGLQQSRQRPERPRATVTSAIAAYRQAIR